MSRTSCAPGRLIRATSIGRSQRELPGQVQVVERIVGEDSIAGQRRFAVVEHHREHQVGPVDLAVAVPRLVGQEVALLDPSSSPDRLRSLVSSTRTVAPGASVPRR